MAQIVGATNIGGYEKGNSNTNFNYVRNSPNADISIIGSHFAYAYSPSSGHVQVDRFLFSFNTSTVSNILESGSIKMKINGDVSNNNRGILAKTEAFSSSDLSVWSSHLPNITEYSDLVTIHQGSISKTVEFTLTNQALLDIKNDNVVHFVLLASNDYSDNISPLTTNDVVSYTPNTDIILDYTEFINDIYPLGITQYKNVNGVLMADIGGII